MSKEKENGKGKKESTNHTGEAEVKLVDALFDTSEEQLPSLTRIDRRAVLPLSIQIMKEQALDPERIKNHIPLSRVWRNAYFKLQRSVDRWYFMVSAGLAREQMQTKEEETVEGEEF